MANRFVEQGVDRREAIMGFIAGFIAENHYSPTVREITDGVGLTSTNAVHGHLMRLMDEGRITMRPGANRTIALVGRRRRA
jgi:repressor LexA